MKILITGGSGYLAQSLVEAIADDPKLDIIVSTRKPSILTKKYDNVDVVGTPDFLDECDWAQYLNDVDIVVHTSALVHDQARKSTSYDIYKVNYEATRKLVEQCLKQNIHRFVFVSSVAVYGNTKFCSVRQSVERNKALLSDYARSKLLAENAVQSLLDASDVKYNILRIPMVYGFNAPGNPNKIVNALRRDYIMPVLGIKNKRSFLDINLFVDYVYRILTDRNFPCGVTLLADREIKSTSDLIIHLAQLHKIKPRLVRVPYIVLWLLKSLTGYSKTINSLVGDHVIVSNLIPFNDTSQFKNKRR